MKIRASALSALWLAGCTANATIDQNIISQAVRLSDGRKLSSSLTLSEKHSIQFKQCVSLTTEVYDYDFLYSVSSGVAKSEMSYVLFNVCETENCGYQANDNVYLVDLRTFIRSTMSFYPTKHERYCMACEASEEYCEQYYEKKAEYKKYIQEQQQKAYENQYNQYAQQNAQQMYNGYNNGGHRFLQYNNYYNSNNYQIDTSTIEQVTCDKCYEKKCFSDNFVKADEEVAQAENGYPNQYQNGNYQNANYQNANYQNVNYQNYNYQLNSGYYNQYAQDQGDNINIEDLADWIKSISQCMQTGYKWNGQELYAGFLCNADGTGVEIGMFLDKYCSVYTSQVSFMNAMANGGSNNNGNRNGGNNNNNNNNNGNYDIAYLYAAQDVVTYPFTHDIDCAETLTYATPWGAYHQGGYYSVPPNKYCTGLFQYSVIALEDCDSDNVRDSKQSNYKYSGYVPQYQNSYQNGYTTKYLLSQQDLKDQVKVCHTIRTASRGELSVFDSSQGTFFDYSAAKEKKYPNKQIKVFEGERQGLKLFGLITGFLIAFVAIVFFIKDFCCFEVGSGRRERLVIDGDKAYAQELS